MPHCASLNDLPSNAKVVSIALLNGLLADAIDLALLTRQAHWNIRGPNFVALHEMTDDFRHELDTHIDTLAERVLQLGGTALGTTQSVAAATTLARYPIDIDQTKDHLAALIQQYATVSSNVCEAIDAVEAGDAATNDLLIAFSRALDKQLWFLEAHVQESE